MLVKLGRSDQEDFYVKVLSPEGKSSYIDVKDWKYPAGEIGVELEFKTTADELGLESLDQAESFEIFALIRNSDELMKTFMVTNAIRNHYPKKKIVLHCPYIPYARQDRVCAEGQSFSMEVAAGLINAQNYYRVVGLDAHSKIAESLINNYLPDDFAAVMMSSLLSTFKKEIISNSLLICPDSGAIVRTLIAAEAVGAKISGVGRKNRNPRTGEILNVEVDLIYQIKGRDLIIIDDICDGGRSFIELAKVLRPFCPKTLSLYVSHGIFSKGLQVFEGLFDYISCGYYVGKEDPVDLLSAISGEKSE